MGFVVTCNGKDVWQPSLVVGNLFFEQIQSIEKVISQPSGITSPFDDELEVDKTEFQHFLLSWSKYLSESNNPQLKALMSGCLEVSLHLHRIISGSEAEIPPELSATQGE